MATDSLTELLNRRFGAGTCRVVQIDGAGALEGMAGRGSCRQFTAEPVPRDLVRTLCAVALSAPSKSDLQQRDIVLLTDPDLRARIAGLVAGQDWVKDAPNIAIFCGNNRRQRQLHDRAGVPFANDHLDAFFNAAVDAGVALSAFVTAAEAVGLGCCPISGVRNRVDEVARLLDLPDHVFPVAGMAFGYPAGPSRLSFRLPLEVTVHENQFAETEVDDAIATYDARRLDNGDYPTQRFEGQFGHKPDYSWSDDKVRQYSQPERDTFGAYVRRIGFVLE
ncbi:MAG: nitroreductase family protein [Pseudomonadota bacterium]